MAILVFSVTFSCDFLEKDSYSFSMEDHLEVGAVIKVSFPSGLWSPTQFLLSIIQERGVYVTTLVLYG